MKMRYSLLFFFSWIFLNCQEAEVKPQSINDFELQHENEYPTIPLNDNSIKSIHVFVALCDNQYQGIVPVPAKIGNGSDPANNLYWGCAFGVKTYFKKSSQWKWIKNLAIDSVRLERIVFQHISKKNIYLIADAYRGKDIRQCTLDFMKGSCGQYKDTVHVGNDIVGLAGNAHLLAYTGHDGLMDFSLDDNFSNVDSKERYIIVLACYSKRFFAPYLQQSKVRPLVWSTHLMSPEAYTLHDAISGYLNGESPESIRGKAASAYAQYQKCSLQAAKNLLVSGF